MQHDEFDLFLSEMAGVKPLSHDAVALLPGEFSPTLAQQARRKAAEQEVEYDEHYLSMEYVELVKPDDVFAYCKDGVQQGVYRNLRLGKYQLDATLNLLGKSLTEARSSLQQFINECHARGVRTLLIQHGMGRHSKPHPAILRSYVFKWLPSFDIVLAAHTAQRQHGSYSATYVLLQKNAEQKRENRERHTKK